MILGSRLRGNDSLFRGASLVGCAFCYVLVAQRYTKFGTKFDRVFFKHTSTGSATENDAISGSRLRGNDSLLGCFIGMRLSLVLDLRDFF